MELEGPENRAKTKTAVLRGSVMYLEQIYAGTLVF